MIRFSNRTVMMSGKSSSNRRGMRIATKSTGSGPVSRARSAAANQYRLQGHEAQRVPARHQRGMVSRIDHRQVQVLGVDERRARRMGFSLAR